MDLTHEFSVPTPVGETWDHFQDIAAVAECFPGATVSETDGDTFRGSCKVKLGPIALVYQGSGTFVERDDSAHRFVVDAKGKDKRGNGTAAAQVTVTMSESGGGTDVRVVTDLAITGKPAQFGRGVMQDVSDKLLGQFVACLEDRLAAPAPAPADEPEQTAAATAQSTSGEPVADAGSASATSIGTPTPDPVGSAETESAGPAAPPRDDALDLGATVLPVLLRSYGKQVAAGVAGLVALLLLRRLLRCR